MIYRLGSDDQTRGKAADLATYPTLAWSPRSPSLALLLVQRLHQAARPPRQRAQLPLPEEQGPRQLSGGAERLYPGP